MSAGLAIFNNEPWRDEIVFLNVDGQPLPVAAPVLIGLRSKWKAKGYDLIVLPEEITIIENVARFEVPMERMLGLPAERYILEVGMGAGSARDIFSQTGISVIEGVNP